MNTIFRQRIFMIIHVTTFWLENLKGRYHWIDLTVDVGITVKWRIKQ